ncbi:RNA polymerase sigma factor [Sphingobacterium alkalisoli]|uniref:RNA polymerase sigma factor n=1 Tax=Sphingobacterium alkalisoli TaxID=1874115 RepID=A0A4U0H518_9SPHI|nr:RNA polymerase sigma factor [Sphingobacterium alkalisoli]TJY66676.1 RNA polymerase sigma factor [Sphingobacterium alkalisoli]GGH14878.1 DNA-directed RNA polymerase sigma-70 factor [Sphingobacterium alkalisoli]
MVDIIKQQKEFTKILEEHLGILLKISAVYSKTRQDREDLLDEMTYQLWKSFSTFEGRSALSTWVYRVALNTALSKLKQDKRQSLLFFWDNSPNWDQHIISEDPSLYEMYDKLYETIEMLNAFDKAIILLYLDRHSHEQIGIIMGISQSNVGTRIGRIKHQLKDLASK